MLCRGFRPLVISMAMVMQYLISLLNASISSKLTPKPAFDLMKIIGKV
jgi:hypothetical protein